MLFFLFNFLIIFLFNHADANESSTVESATSVLASSTVVLHSTLSARPSMVPTPTEPTSSTMSAGM